MTEPTEPDDFRDARAKVFRDREGRDEWRVEKQHEDGSCEVAIFAGPGAWERALIYADRQYGLASVFGL
jgi:hypothetical protein